MTLIELMIVVAIVGILASVAYPSYERYVIKVNRSEAQNFMMEVASRQEQYLADARRYGTLAQLNVTVPERANTFYTITVTPNNSATPPSYVIQAAPRAGTRQAADGTLQLDSTGVQTPEDKWR